MTEPKNISWKRISVEAAAIVASILVAFAIDAWWDERQERSKLSDTLMGLEAALSSNLKIINENIELATFNKNVVQAFVQMTPDEAAQIPITERYSTLASLYRNATLDINNSFIVEILDANSLETLTDASLRDAIGRWRGAVDGISKARFSLENSQEDVLQALARHEEIGSVLAQDKEDKDDLSDDAMRLVRGDPDILVHVSLIALHHRGHISNLNSLKVETEAILSNLQSAQNP